MKKQTIFLIILGGTLVTLFIIGLFTILSKARWFQSANGQHTGIVTATEVNGIFVKTDSQEDSYCAEDSDVFAKLVKAEEDQTPVTIKYNDYVLVSGFRCLRSSAFIYEVDDVQK